MEAVVLAGGLGTRLRSEVADLPKILAPVAGRPFIFHLFEFLLKNGIDRLILATGYLQDEVEKTIGASWQDLQVIYSEEEEPLGTGGAIRKALRKAEQPYVFVFNGDTLFEVPLPGMMQQHLATGSLLTLALKRMENIDRYGTVRLSEHGRVTEFVEKKSVAHGFINGGCYLMKKDIFQGLNLPERFSLEEDFLKSFIRSVGVYGYVTDAYFIDIGIPEDYKRAQIELLK